MVEKMEELVRIYKKYRLLKRSIEGEHYPLDPQKIKEDQSIGKLLLGVNGKRGRKLYRLGGWS